MQHTGPLRRRGTIWIPADVRYLTAAHGHDLVHGARAPLSAWCWWVDDREADVVSGP